YLYWSDDGGRTVSVHDPTGNPLGLDISWIDASGTAACNWLNSGQVGVFQPRVGHYALAGIGDYGVLFAYPGVEDVPGVPGRARQVFRIVWVQTWPPGDNSDPFVQPIATIRATNPMGSVLQGTIVQNDRPAVEGARTALIYWVETDGPPQPTGVG